MLECNDALVWQALYDKGVEIARDVDVEPAMPRQYGRLRNRPNAPGDTPLWYWKANMFLPFADHMLVELSDRLLQANGRFEGTALVAK